MLGVMSISLIILHDTLYLLVRYIVGKTNMVQNITNLQI